MDYRLIINIGIGVALGGIIFSILKLIKEFITETYEFEEVVRIIWGAICLCILILIGFFILK